MKVKYLITYRSKNRVEVENYASVTVFNEGHNVLVGEFAVDCANFYNKITENFLSEEVPPLKLYLVNCD